MPGFAPDNCLFRPKFSLASQLARFTRFGQVRQITYFNDVGENLSLAVEVVHPAYSPRPFDTKSIIKTLNQIFKL